MDSSAKILNDNGELNTSVGQSCSDSQLSGVSISTVQSEHDCEETQDLQQSPPELQHGLEYNSSQLSDETTITGFSQRGSYCGQPRVSSINC